MNYKNEVRWTRLQLLRSSGIELSITVNLKTITETNIFIWHWTHFYSHTHSHSFVLIVPVQAAALLLLLLLYFAIMWHENASCWIRWEICSTRVRVHFPMLKALLRFHTHLISRCSSAQNRVSLSPTPHCRTTWDSITKVIHCLISNVVHHGFQAVHIHQCCVRYHFQLIWLIMLVGKPVPRLPISEWCVNIFWREVGHCGPTYLVAEM